MRNVLGVLGTLVRVHFTFRLPLSATASSLSGPQGEGFLRPFDQIDRVDRSTTKDVQYIVLDCIAVHVVDATMCNENQKKERKRKSLRRTTEEEQERRREKRRSCRVAASCNELHKRKRSHVILNEARLRLLCPHQPLSKPSLLISVLPQSLSPFLSFRVRRATALFFPPPGRS